jgi:cytochrome c oxidase cbb3-type subunit III
MNKLCLLLLAMAALASGQEAASPGQPVYLANCVFCHGQGARGGSQGGPDLAKSAIVRGDVNGKQLGEFLNVGKPDKGMPAFHLPEAQVKALAAFLHSVVETSEEHPEFGRDILIGDPAAGKTFFEHGGGCVKCHSVAQDLKGIGSKYAPVELQGRIVLPRGKGGYPGFEDAEPSKLVAHVTTPDGKTLSGSVTFVSDYYVTFVDHRGEHHTVARHSTTAKVSIEDSLAPHLALQSRLTDKQMHDLTAYLAGIK